VESGEGEMLENAPKASLQDASAIEGESVTDTASPITSAQEGGAANEEETKPKIGARVAVKSDKEAVYASTAQDDTNAKVDPPIPVVSPSTSAGHEKDSKVSEKKIAGLQAALQEVVQKKVDAAAREDFHHASKYKKEQLRLTKEIEAVVRGDGDAVSSFRGVIPRTKNKHKRIKRENSHNKQENSHNNCNNGNSVQLYPPPHRLLHTPFICAKCGGTRQGQAQGEGKTWTVCSTCFHPTALQVVAPSERQHRAMVQWLDSHASRQMFSNLEELMADPPSTEKHTNHDHSTGTGSNSNSTSNSTSTSTSTSSADTGKRLFDQVGGVSSLPTV